LHKTTKGDIWLIHILNQCAWAAAHTRDIYLLAQFWRLARRIGKNKAAIAVGHSILVICWHLLSDDADYADLVGYYFTPPQPRPTHHPAHDLGYRVTLDKVA
jgi:transposase